jgi:hypothetical protein
MGYDQCLGRKDIIKFVYCLMIIFITLYIFKYFFTVSTTWSPREYNNIVILSLIIFYLN